ncbi:hypothetical protein HBI25_075650 [Parastagonospora nodorum]|nr:hypothetical protein HBI73_017230 [Parastagonospora nodorum]KAH5221213.1 hypothetical protein HBH68_039830 [Parastagonospora nodorum]KAH5282638.1 hypothetical protein HBI70_063450 [Parastagonospora nodorum]KAH5332091.1 hypothetical protein HBI12_054550 [Parastagonospora nodorum]KAH5364831.1 hypothetical protein HBI48_074000 [Parastagonospora nodorum]
MTKNSGSPACPDDSNHNKDTKAGASVSRARPRSHGGSKDAKANASTSRVQSNLHDGGESSDITTNLSYADKLRQGRPPSANDGLRAGDHTDKIIDNIDRMTRKCEQDLQEQKSKTRRLEEENITLRKEALVHDRKTEDRVFRIDYLDKLFNDIVNKTIKPYADANEIRYPLKFDDKVLVGILKPLLRDALQARSLRTQVQALQDELLTKVEKVHAIADDNLAQDFRNIVSLVKELSRTTKPEEQQDMIAILNRPNLLHNVGANLWSSRMQKKLYIEAWIWCVLVNYVFRGPFAIFGKEGNNCSELYNKMFGNMLQHGWPIPTPASEVWRCTTIDHLATFIRPEALNSWNMKSEHNHLEENVVKVRTGVLKVLSSGLEPFLPSVDLAPLRHVIDKACSLALQIHCQRFRLMVTHPMVGDTFNNDSMVSIPNIYGEELDAGMVAFVINPGLTKHGDVHGKNLDQRYDIVPALVQLESVSDMYIYEDAYMIGVSER